jgi:hypothetical protein
MHAMYNACVNGRVDEVRRLLDAGGDVNGFMNWTPVMDALRNGHIAVVRLMHDRGADLSRVDGSGRIVLHKAASGGNVECIEFVLAVTTIDVNSTNNFGTTPIMNAMSRLEASKLLVERGANLFAKNNSDVRPIDGDNGPQVLQHAKDFLWESVKPLLLLSKSCSSADDGSLSLALPSAIKVFGISGLVRDYIAPYLMRKGPIIRDPEDEEDDEEQEPDEVKLRIEAGLAAGSSSSNSSSSSS